MIVLAWLQKPLHKMKVFVANRIAMIRDFLQDSEWQHVQSEYNPADLPSRGVSAKELAKSELWWKGPPWLSLQVQQWPSQPEITVEELPGIKKEPAVVLLSTENGKFQLWSHYSCYNKLTRVLAWVLKFAHKCKSSAAADRTDSTASSDHPELHLMFDDYRMAETALLIQRQKESFSDEYQSLLMNKSVSPSSKLRGLSDVMLKCHDNMKMIKVRGRASEKWLTPVNARSCWKQHTECMDMLELPPSLASWPTNFISLGLRKR